MYFHILPTYWLKGGILLSLLVDEKLDKDDDVDEALELPAAVACAPELFLVLLLFVAIVLACWPLRLPV